VWWLSVMMSRMMVLGRYSENFREITTLLLYYVFLTPYDFIFALLKFLARDSKLLYVILFRESSKQKKLLG
jgi:hypothetical protein